MVSRLRVCFVLATSAPASAAIRAPATMRSGVPELGPRRLPRELLGEWRRLLGEQTGELGTVEPGSWR